MIKIATLAALASCAATTPPSTEVARVIPVPIDPQLPSVDRIANRVVAELGTSPSDELKVCVHPAGNIASVELVGGTSFLPFDDAVVEDASEWKFTPTPGPATVQTCELTTIAYHAPR